MQTISLNKFISDFASIQNLDPLNFADYQSVLINFNEGEEVRELIGIAHELIQKYQQSPAQDPATAIAMARDMGIVAGSIKKLQIAPVKEVAQIDDVFVNLGSLCQLPERDTLLHYTLWNPTGEQMRTFTGTTKERAFITKLQEVLSRYPEKELLKLVNLANAMVGAESLAEVSKAIEFPLEEIVSAMEEHLATPFIQEVLQPYFAEVNIKGKQLSAPCSFLFL
ncbi:monodechloroaminopyrrolnitrin synthase PrnB family protein [Algivirga pacifica]|uniref:Uncharacterized protein n=1 Tax=Algivirga pacifica TaxID=1162670 RepID=A0ABP9CYJ2_9BACT